MGSCTVNQPSFCTAPLPRSTGSGLLELIARAGTPGGVRGPRTAARSFSDELLIAFVASGDVLDVAPFRRWRRSS
jgi:hypothetical protein